VRSALTNPGLPVANKRALMADLLEGRVSRRAAALVDLLVEVDEGHDIDTVLKEWAEAAAARRDRVVAEVRSAVELDDRRRARLAEALTRVLGTPVVLQDLRRHSYLGLGRSSASGTSCSTAASAAASSRPARHSGSP
jgi:F-type H+-transporting ATPase subunit delta